MSELKVIDLGNIRESIEKGESVYYEYYAKSEADKVIARHKYKRCLAMAMWCETELEKLDYKEAIDYTNKDVWRIATSYFTIWHKRWLELAEKFKPNNKE